MARIPIQTRSEDLKRLPRPMAAKPNQIANRAAVSRINASTMGICTKLLKVSREFVK